MFLTIRRTVLELPKGVIFHVQNERFINCKHQKTGRMEILVKREIFRKRSSAQLSRNSHQRGRTLI